MRVKDGGRKTLLDFCSKLKIIKTMNDGNIMPFCNSIIVFDLDDTLLSTWDLINERIYYWNKCYTAAELYWRLIQQLKARPYRLNYSQNDLIKLKLLGCKQIGVISLSPQQYCEDLLRIVYPGFSFDFIYGRGGSIKSKPNLEAINLIKSKADSVIPPVSVVCVGNEKSDLDYAYHVTPHSLLEVSIQTEKNKYRSNMYESLLPECKIKGIDDLERYLNEPRSFLPAGEYALELFNYAKDHHQGFDFYLAALAKRTFRFEDVQHNSSFMSVCGRYFTSAQRRNFQHDYSSSLLQFKEHLTEIEFWASLVLVYLQQRFAGKQVYVCCVGAKPGRIKRMESLLSKVAELRSAHAPLYTVRIENLGAVVDFAESSHVMHQEHLTKEERRERVSSEMLISDKTAGMLRQIRGGNFVIIDDVVTTGATLYTARSLLCSSGCGDSSVSLLAFAQTV